MRKSNAFYSFLVREPISNRTLSGVLVVTGLEALTHGDLVLKNECHGNFLDGRVFSGAIMSGK